MSSPDYQTVDKDQAVQDFRDRISVYEKQYHTLDEELDKNLSFIKIFNQGERYLINNIYGIQSAVCLSVCMYVCRVVWCVAYLITFIVKKLCVQTVQL